MNQLNSLIIEGNVTRTPMQRETPNGFKICTIPLAVNRFYRNQKGEGISEVSYFDIETFGKMAESCAKNCNKGRGLRVVGRIKQNRWKNPEGKSFSRIAIIAERVEFKKRITKVSTETNLAEMAKANEATIAGELALEKAREKEMATELINDQLDEVAVF